MAKIKRKVEMTPKEFLKHLLEQEETEVELYDYTFDYNEEHYSFDPKIIANEVISYNPHSGTFTVEIEEEIDEDTVLPMFIEIFTGVDDEIFIDYHENENIKEVLEINSSRAKTKTFNLINNDGTMTLIWKDGAMV
ncbi:hypothetical protein ACUXP2_000370 [Staphylococcus haemolyticus]